MLQKLEWGRTVTPGKTSLELITNTEQPVNGGMKSGEKKSLLFIFTIKSGRKGRLEECITNNKYRYFN